MYELPAYLFWGFLESGKTTLIKDTLSQDYFNDGEKTMILSFEEGEEEYDKEMLEKTGLGICMENGSETVKAVADDICPSVTEDGIWKAFQKHHLI